MLLAVAVSICCRAPEAGEVSVCAWGRPLIVGAGGQVGGALQRCLEAQGCVEVVRSSREARAGWLRLDLAKLRSSSDAERALAGTEPDAILCAGAMTFVDGCEDDPELAFRANAHGPAALASYAQWRGVPFVFFSSDYVFDGSPENPGPYTEHDAARPLSVYGESKMMGERAVLRVNPQALVVRTSWVYGPDVAGKNFISALRRQLGAGQVLRVPADQVSTPTLNVDLAEITLALVRAGVSGVVHVAGPELLSRLELAKAVARHFSLDEGLIEGRTTASLGQRARRPLHSGLRSEILSAVLPGRSPRSLEEGLRATATAWGAKEMACV